MKNQTGLQSTQYIAEGRADFNVNDFDTLINQKGYSVIVEQVLRCPCKSRNTGNSSLCKNCGGTGYAWINPTCTRMVLQGINVIDKFEPWSEEARGVMNVSCKAEEELSFMDRITVKDGESTFTETIFLNSSNNQFFAYTGYAVKKMKYIAAFVSNAVGYRKLTSNQYDINGNILTIRTSAISDIIGYPSDVSLTIRYTHAPQFCIVEMKRETMQSFTLVNGNGEKIQNLPLSAYARRLHYVMQPVSLSGDKLIDNSYQNSECCPSNPDIGPIIPEININDDYFIPENNIDVGAVKLSQISDFPDDIDDTIVFTGLQSNEDGSFTNYNFTYEQLQTAVISNSRIRIIVAEDSESLINSWFTGKDIQKLITNAQIYIKDVSYTQSGDTLTGIDIEFTVGQVVIAEV